MAVEVRDTGWVDSRSMFYRRGYYQRDAYRTNGDRFGSPATIVGKSMKSAAG